MRQATNSELISVNLRLALYLSYGVGLPLSTDKCNSNELHLGQSSDCALSISGNISLFLVKGRQLLLKDNLLDEEALRVAALSDFTQEQRVSKLEQSLDGLTTR